MIKNGETEFLRQLVSSLQKAEPSLEEAYKNKSEVEFNRLKKFILQIQDKIEEVIE